MQTDNTLLNYARRKAKEILESETNIAQSPDVTVCRLKKRLHHEQQKMSERTYRYLCRELSYLMAHDRGLHAIASANREFLRGGTFSNRILNENSKEHTLAAKNYGYSVTPEELSTIRELVSGKHLSDLQDVTVSQTTLASAMELYPLDTVRWLKERKPDTLTPEFAEVLGQHTIYGINAYDIEQFVPKEIKKELPQNLQAAFDAGIMKARNEIKTNILQKKEKFGRRPLPTQEDENRRRENSSRYSMNFQYDNEILRNLLSVTFRDGKNLNEKCFDEYDNAVKDSNRMYEYNLRGPAPLLSSIPQNPQIQNVNFDGSNLRIRPFYPQNRPNDLRTFTEMWNTSVTNLDKRNRNILGTPYHNGGKFVNVSAENPKLDNNKGLDCSGAAQWNIVTFMNNLNKYSKENYNCYIFPQRTVKKFENRNQPLDSTNIGNVVKECTYFEKKSENQSASIAPTLLSENKLEKTPYSMLVLQRPKNPVTGHVAIAVRNPKTNKFYVYESTSESHAVRIIPYEKWRIGRGRNASLYNTMPIEKLMDPNALKIIQKKEQEFRIRQQQEEEARKREEVREQQKFFHVPMPEQKRQEEDEDLQIRMRFV